jgi:hypothetical protein
MVEKKPFVHLTHRKMCFESQARVLFHILYARRLSLSRARWILR